MRAQDLELSVLTRAVNAFPDALGLLDITGFLLHANPGLGRLLNAAPADLQGCPLHELAVDEPEHVDALLRRWAGSSTLRPGTLRLLTHAARQSDAAEVVRCDGARVGTSTLVVRLAQRPRASMLFGRVTQEVEARNLRDTTLRLERSLAEQRRLNDLLTQANAELSQFASVVSHDLNAPLVTLSGYVELLRTDYGKVLEDGMQFLEAIGRSAQRMSEVIGGLRALTRIEQSDAPEVVTDSAVALQAALENLTSPLRSSGARVDVESMLPVPIPETYLVQVLQNLVGNSVKFRSPQRPLVIHVGSWREEDRVEFEVRDNGLGVHEEECEQIFELFGRGRAGAVEEGLGIGLAICRKILERFGGRIWCEPAAPEGAIFRFTLPGAEKSTS